MPGTTSPPGERPEAPTGGYSGLQANGKLSSQNPGQEGEFHPRSLPILHAPVYLLGQDLAPGQPADSPVLANPLIAGNQGPTFHGRASTPDGLQPRPLP